MSNTALYGAEMASTLSRTNWIDQGLKALARSGFSALKADALAKELGVSRGSFYWHFRDVEQYHAALLAAWRDRATDRVIVEMEQETDSEQSLRALVRKSMRADDRLELGIRTWARHSTVAEAAVSGVDRARLKYVRKLLQACGVDESHVSARAAFLYWASLGRSMVIDAKKTASPAEIDSLIDMLLS